MKTEKILPLKLVNLHKLKVLLLINIIITITLSGKAQPWTLQQCIDTAQLHNKNLQISRNNMEIVSQKQKEATANLFPKVSIAGDYKYFTDLPYQLMPLSTFNPTAPEGQFKEAQFGVPHNMSAYIQFTMPLYNPQIYGGIKTSKIAADLTDLQYKKTEEQVYFDISNMYFNIQILQHQLAFIDSNIVNTTKLLGNMQLLCKQLMVKDTDVSKVELQKDQLLTQRDVVANNLEQLMNALKFSMGLPISQSLEINREIHSASINEYSNEPNIDIQLASTQKRMLSSELRALMYSRLPSVSLYGSYGQIGYGYDKKPNDFLKFFPTSFVGIQLSFPLFNGTVTYRKINQKKIEIQNNELQINLIKDQTSLHIENATNRLILLQKTMGNNITQIDLAGKVYEQMIIQQKEGTTSLTDVLLADNALREAQQTYLSTVVDFLKTDLELKKLTGNILLKN